VVLLDETDKLKRVFHSDGLVRLSATYPHCIDPDLQVFDSEYAINLPPKKAGQYVIVTQAVALARPGRTDLVYPVVSHRNNNGEIIGYKKLAKIPV
jgi:hypothetical protein